MTPYMQPGYSPQGYPFPAQPPPEQNSFQPVQYGTPAEAPTWGYSPIDRPPQQYGNSALPPVPSMGRNEASTESDVAFSASNPPQVDNAWQVNSTRENGEEISYHTWPTERYPPMDNPSNTIDPALRNPSVQPAAANPAWPASPSEHYTGARYNNYSQPQMPPQATPAPASQTPLDTSIYASASYAQHQQEQQAQSQYHQGKPYAQESTPPSTIPPLPRHTYTRTLVGPLSANACRLLDEHRKPGIFFLFQDLSIRTEGMHLITLLG